ncbi:hypothetical protein ABZP36_002550 [Zizania latifolia]
MGGVVNQGYPRWVCVLVRDVGVDGFAAGISASPWEENMRYFNVMILGPAQSPYEELKNPLHPPDHHRRQGRRRHSHLSPPPLLPSSAATSFANVVPHQVHAEKTLTKVIILSAGILNFATKMKSPFEFRALEVTLEAIYSFFDARTTEFESGAYPTLDELTSKYVKPHDHEKLSQIELLVIDEAAAIPLPIVKSILWCGVCWRGSAMGAVVTSGLGEAMFGGFPASDLGEGCGQ